MIVRNMRWGYDGGGMACGPVEGNSVVELVITHNDAVVFITVSRMSENENVYVAPFSLFDKLIQANNCDVDFCAELDKIENICTEFYSHEIYDDEDFKESKLYEAINLARLAMKEYYDKGMLSEDEEQAECKKFIDKYIDKDATKLNIPVVEYEYDEDDEDEEDEEDDE